MMMGPAPMIMIFLRSRRFFTSLMAICHGRLPRAGGGTVVAEASVAPGTCVSSLGAAPRLSSPLPPSCSRPELMPLLLLRLRPLRLLLPQLTLLARPLQAEEGTRCCCCCDAATTGAAACCWGCCGSGSRPRLSSMIKI